MKYYVCERLDNDRIRLYGWSTNPKVANGLAEELGKYTFTVLNQYAFDQFCNSEKVVIT